MPLIPGTKLGQYEVVEPTFESQEFAVTLFTTGSQSYDVAPNCDRCVTIAGTDPNVAGLRVILNWTKELERLVPTGN